ALVYTPEGLLRGWVEAAGQTAVLRDPLTREERRVFHCTGTVRSVAVSRDAQTLVTTSDLPGMFGKGYEMRLWDLAKGEERWAVQLPFAPWSWFLFSNDGAALVAVAEDGAVKAWDTTTGRETASFKARSWIRIHHTPLLLPDGKTLILEGLHEDSTGK